MKVWLVDYFPFQAAGLFSGSFAVHFPGCTLPFARSFQHVIFEFPKFGIYKGVSIEPTLRVISSVPVLSLLRWKMIACFCVYRKKITKLINSHVLMYLSCVYRFIVVFNLYNLLGIFVMPYLDLEFIVPLRF